MSNRNVMVDVYGMAEQRRFARVPTMVSKSPLLGKATKKTNGAASKP